MTGAGVATRPADSVAGHPVDYQAVLRTLKLDPQQPQTQALLLVCQRYGLDPVLRHVVLIDGRPYVTRDGLLHVAHQSGQLDGIEVLEESETPAEWTARVAVHRADMRRPFVYRGRYPKSGANKKYGPEMAVKCGEAMSLRRAFDVAVATVEERWDTPETPAAGAPPAVPAGGRDTPAPPPGHVLPAVVEVGPPARPLGGVGAAEAEAEVAEAVAAARAAGVEGDYDALAAYAARGPEHAARAVARLREMLASHDAAAASDPGVPFESASGEQHARIADLQARSGLDADGFRRLVARHAEGSQDPDDLTARQADAVIADLTGLAAVYGDGGGAS